LNFLRLKVPKANQQSNTTLGYHGTRQEHADEIMKTHFKPTKPDTGAYLGEGVYFFDNQLSHAKKWATTQAGKRQKGTIVAVIESEVKYGNLLNLTDTDTFGMVEKFRRDFEQKAQKKVSLATIIDIAAEKTAVDVVKACRYPYNTLLDPGGFSADMEIILAVRAIGNILSKQVIWSEMIGF